jgi:hypothetical protein
MVVDVFGSIAAFCKMNEEQKAVAHAGGGRCFRWQAEVF